MTEQSVDHILRQRRSIRKYLDTPVSQSDVAAILRAARCAPSGANLQPGRFHVLTGQPLTRLTDALIAAEHDKREIVSEYSYFPDPLPAELKQKQRRAGFALYASLGIEKRDVLRRREQFSENYRFFDAPVAIVVTIERSMGKGCFMDLGLSLMSLFLSAEAKGFGTSGIGALANRADVVQTTLGLPHSEMVVCGIALGLPDPDAPVNQFRTERDDLPTFSTFQGFPES